MGYVIDKTINFTPEEEADVLRRGVAYLLMKHKPDPAAFPVKFVVPCSLGGVFIASSSTAPMKKV